MVESAKSLAFPTFDSPIGEMMEGRGGAALNDLIVRNGQRSNIFRSYVFPKLGQPNLTVLTHALVSRLIFNGTTVAGVEIIEAGERRRYMADREVILSLGAINTPKVLMQSGIGPDADLVIGAPSVSHGQMALGFSHLPQARASRTGLTQSLCK